MKAPQLDYIRPASLPAALAALADAGEGASILAGGQSLGPMLNLRVARPTLLVDISRLAELTGVEEDGESLSIGAAIPHADFEDGVVPDRSAGLMQHTAGTIAYRAVRNRGTIGGSLSHADPVGDWCPVLLALGVSLTAVHRDGSRTIPIADFVEGVMSTCLRPGEILTRVVVPKLGRRARWGRFKTTRKPGKFADAIAVAVSDPERSVYRLALAAPNRPPALLPSTAAKLGQISSWSPEAAGAIRSAARDELAAQGETDRLQLHVLSVAAERAVARAFQQ